MLTAAGVAFEVHIYHDSPDLLGWVVNLAVPPNGILIDDHITEANEASSYGFGCRLAQVLRTRSSIAGQLNPLQRLPIVILGSLRLEQYLLKAPDHVFACSPGITYVSYLDGTLPLGDFPVAEPLSDDDLQEMLRYLPGASAFTGGKFNRHKAASTFGLGALQLFVRFLAEAYGVQWPQSWQAPDAFLAADLQADMGLELSRMFFAFEQRSAAMREKIIAERTQVEALMQGTCKQLAQDNRVVALIDDEAARPLHAEVGGMGWRDAIGALLPSQSARVLDVLIEVGGALADHDAICQLIEERNTACILLDIYLHPHELRGGIREKSGAKLLERLRRTFPTLPIIVFTASNKPWKHRDLMSLGADAIWVKEGFDEARSPEQSYYNIYRLLKLLQAATSREYRFLTLLGDRVAALCDRKKNFWWTARSITWQFGHPSSGRLTVSHEDGHRKAVEEILKEILMLLRSFLNQTELQFFEGSGAPEAKRKEAEEAYRNNIMRTPSVSFLASTIVINIGKIVEAIHGQTRMNTASNDRVNAPVMGGHRLKDGSFKIHRGDWIGYWLFQHRNECAHYFTGVEYELYATEPAKGSLAHLLSVLVAYLHYEGGMPYHTHEAQWLTECDNANRDLHRKTAPGFIDKYAHENRRQLGMATFKNNYQAMLNSIKP